MEETDTMTVSRSALKAKAESVRNSYPEYVWFVLENCKEFDISEDVISFIDENPGCSSGSVIGFIADRLDFKPLKIVKDE